MATGFECDFVEKPPITFPQSECPICLLVLKEPYQATCCGKSFCKRCIHRIQAANQACPTCNEKNFNLFPNKGLQQPLYDFQVSCTHKSKGCEWTGELRELDNHLNSDPPADKVLQGCPYTLIKCPLDCAGCEKGVCRKDIKSHVNDKLLSHVMIQSAQIKDVSAKLARLEAACEQGMTKLNTTFGQRMTNLEAALEQRMTNLDAAFEQRMTNLEAAFEQRMTKLEVAFQQGMKKIENKISELDRVMIASKPQPLEQLQQPDGCVTDICKPVVAEFTMTNFEEHKRNEKVWYSPHFYTHPNGYKMCLRVDANGSTGSGRGTHLSVFVCLKRGEYDDLLKWPFRGNISIKLVNQEEDKDHTVEKIRFTKPIYGRRVMTDKPSGGYGCGQFLPFTKLQPKYLKNDCIKLCVKEVEIL